MPDFLLELFSEEIPARMQARAAEDLRKAVTDALVAAGYVYEGAKAYATPRRLTLHIVGLPAKGRDVREERRGPRVGAPEAALGGFLKSTGLTSPDQLGRMSDGKKGEFYVATLERPGRPTTEVLAEILPPIIRAFPWPKSMRWGAASAQPGSLRWVRPLHSILCTFGDDVETPELVAFEIDGIVAGDATQGHRFMAPGAIKARRFDDYVAALAASKVVLDAERRRDIIRHDARDLAFAQGLEVVEDEGLLAEVAGLVEWPVALIGTFDERFLAIPPEVIRATIRANQKCFVLRSGATGGEGGRLANKFILVANIEAPDGGAKIVAGNERVVRARLSDAKFFWESDLKSLPDFAGSDLKPLDQRLERLKALDIVFHEKLGTQFQRVERIAALARELAPTVGADPDLAERAARLAKADLVTEMVGEFPELQGLMGRYYATAQGEHPSVAAAIEAHYRPLGPTDRVPTDPVAIAVALADKLDTLVGFWAIDEKPTGSKDPFALRRAALGVIRLVLENNLSVRAASVLDRFYLNLLVSRSSTVQVLQLTPDRSSYRSIRQPGSKGASGWAPGPVLFSGIGSSDFIWLKEEPSAYGVRTSADFREGLITRSPSAENLVSDLLAFFHDRLKVYLRDQGARHDLIEAVLGAGTPPRHAEEARHAPSRSTQDGGASFEAALRSAPQDDKRGGGGDAGSGSDDLLMVMRRVEALGRFLATEDGANLVAGYKRAANILRIEEKKDGRSYDEMPDLAALELDEERALAMALARASAAASEAVGREDFEGAMRALAELRPVVDAFFERVTVNVDAPGLRDNRLRLLNMLRRATREVADFSRIEG